MHEALQREGLRGMDDVLMNINEFKCIPVPKDLLKRHIDIPKLPLILIDDREEYQDIQHMATKGLEFSLKWM